jgi:hypothetical protein
MCHDKISCKTNSHILPAFIDELLYYQILKSIHFYLQYGQLKTKSFGFITKIVSMEQCNQKINN